MKDRPSVVGYARTQLALCEQMRADKVLPQFGEIVRGYWREVLNTPKSRGPFPPQWCGAFALRCLHAAELGTQMQWVIGKGFLYHLPSTHAPEPGDIAYLDKPFQHHAVVCHVAGAIVGTINGNQGDSDPIRYFEHPLEHWTVFFSIGRLLPPSPAPATPSENIA